MDHKLSYKSPILVIQKPNIKFLYATTISMKDTSPSFLFFLIENQSQNLDIMKGQNRVACSSPRKWTITLVIEVQFG